MFKDEAAAPLKQAEIHRKLQAHLSAHDYAVAEFPREHGKTTQLIIRSLWELGRNPNLRIKWVCASDKLAKKRVETLRLMIEGSRELKQVFPKLRPSETSTWTGSHLVVHREVNVPDGSIEAYGITSSATGGRCDILILDDITDDRNSLYSDTRRQHVQDAVDNVWLNFVSPKTGRVWMIGTPWHYEDAFMVKARSPEWAHIRYAIPDDFTPVWSERWSQKELRKKLNRIGSIAFARGFHCQPLSSEEQVINPDWIKFWQPSELPKNLAYYIGVDPAFSDKKRADETAIVVIGRYKNKYYVLSIFHKRGVSLDELVEQVKRMAGRFPPKKVAVEVVGAQAYIKQKLREIGFIVKAYKPNRDKTARVTELGDKFENEQIFLRGVNKAHISQESLYNQLIRFPAADHDDLVDALELAVRSAPRFSIRLLT